METTNKKAVNNSQGTIILPTKEEKSQAPQIISPSANLNHPTIDQIFDKLKNMLGVKVQYEQFSEKLDELIAFQETTDTSGLSMTLRNTDGLEIEIMSQPLIKEFVNLAVSRGQERKTRMEASILAFQL
jgi:hypothetical protein